MENIQVDLRIRPPNEKEIQQNDTQLWALINEQSVGIQSDKIQEFIRSKNIFSGQTSQYTFGTLLNKCYGPKVDNFEIYNNSIKRIISSSLQGTSGTVFMYGQTGSGKTYTMLGQSQKRKEQQKIRESVKSVNQNNSTNKSIDGSQLNDLGILHLSLRDIFQTIENDYNKTYFLKCSYLEIYTDLVYDLMSSQDNLGETLNIQENQNKEFIIKGAIEENIQSIDEIMEKIQKGEQNRHYATTVMNHVSSRSHTIFRLHIKCVNKAQHYLTESVINFVDLAGSEKIAIHDHLSRGSFSTDIANKMPYDLQTQKNRQAESKNINKSLFFLTQVISQRSQGNQDHIAYRNSPLTKILRSSLEGNARTLIVLCINPCASQTEFTLQTLKFGIKAKKIENFISPVNKLTINEETYKNIIKEYESKIKNFEKEQIISIKQNEKIEVGPVDLLFQQELQNEINFLKQKGKEQKFKLDDHLKQIKQIQNEEVRLQQKLLKKKEQINNLKQVLQKQNLEYEKMQNIVNFYQIKHPRCLKELSNQNLLRLDKKMQIFVKIVKQEMKSRQIESPHSETQSQRSEKSLKRQRKYSYQSEYSKCSDVSFDDDFHRAIHQVNPEFLVVKKTIELNQSINKSNTKSENAYSLDENYPNYIVNQKTFKQKKLFPSGNLIYLGRHQQNRKTNLSQKSLSNHGKDEFPEMMMVLKRQQNNFYRLYQFKVIFHQRNLRNS